MDTPNEESFFKKLFKKKEEKSPGRALEFERAVRSDERPREQKAPSVGKVRESTAMFISEAVKVKRFQTAAYTAVARGNSQDAEQIGDQAIEEGKFSQAIQIFEKIGNERKIALANELAARDCLKRGGGRKLAAGRMYAAVQSYGKLLADKGEDRVVMMKKMVSICDDLAVILDETGDVLGAADTWLYSAQLYRYLDPLAHVHEHFTSDPDFFARVDGNLRKDIGKARECYDRYVDDNNVSPQSAQGRKIVEKLKTLQRLTAEILKKEKESEGEPGDG